MDIFDIVINRDGGSVEFRMDNEGSLTHVRLDTPFHGEPRALSIDSTPVSRGDSRVRQLLDNIEKWRLALPQGLQMKIEEVRLHKGAFFNPDATTFQAIDLSRVLYVRDYIKNNYL